MNHHIYIVLFSNFINEPNNPSENEAVNVNVTVTNTAGEISEVFLHWGLAKHPVSSFLFLIVDLCRGHKFSRCHALTRCPLFLLLLFHTNLDCWYPARQWYRMVSKGQWLSKILLFQYLEWLNRYIIHFLIPIYSFRSR